MGMYEGYHFWGMHSIWWIIWIIILFSFFAAPHRFPNKKSKKETALDLLKKRFASGQITKEEYNEHKVILEKE
jgi:putative membrane protein